MKEEIGYDSSKQLNPELLIRSRVAHVFVVLGVPEVTYFSPQTGHGEWCQWLLKSPHVWQQKGLVKKKLRQKMFLLLLKSWFNSSSALHVLHHLPFMLSTVGPQEIGDIQWFPIDMLPKNKREKDIVYNNYVWNMRISQPDQWKNSIVFCFSLVF